MMEWLEGIDRSIVVFCNRMNTPFLDEFMWIVSGKMTWFPFYIALIFLFLRKTNVHKTLLFFFCAVIAVALADLISVHFFKDVFMRYRPSHNHLIGHHLHFYHMGHGEFYKGGQYGFVSSHAANFFAICGFAFFTMKHLYPKLWMILLAFGVLVGFSRMYLGVHYLSDVLVGAMLGVLIAYLVYRFIFSRFIERLTKV